MFTDYLHSVRRDFSYAVALRRHLKEELKTKKFVATPATARRPNIDAHARLVYATLNFADGIEDRVLAAIPMANEPVLPPLPNLTSSLDLQPSDYVTLGNFFTTYTATTNFVQDFLVNINSGRRVLKTLARLLATMDLNTAVYHDKLSKFTNSLGHSMYPVTKMAQPMGQPMNQPMNQSMDQSMDQPMDGQQKLTQGLATTCAEHAKIAAE
jgi:hypothetical protein